jgi:hypothetical protein
LKFMDFLPQHYDVSQWLNELINNHAIAWHWLRSSEHR